MRRGKLESASKSDAAPIFNFYMGKNTPERKDYIVRNLRVEQDILFDAEPMRGDVLAA